MNDNELLAAVKEQRNKIPMTVPVEQVISRGRQVRARRRVPALAAALAITAAAVVAVTSLLPGSQVGGSPTAPHSLRARLLVAIGAVRGDILSAQVRLSGPGENGPGTGTGSEQTLTYPCYPRPGQHVRIRTLGWGSDGRLGKDAESIFTMPGRHGAPAPDPLDPSAWGADLNVTGTFIAVFPDRHTWGKWHHLSLTLGLSADAAGIRHQLANGRLTIIRHGVVNGHQAIELGLTGLSGHGAGLHVTAARLWVDAATYLPLRQVLRFSTGKQDTTDYTFLPPTPANLAKLRPIIPAGYHRTTLLPGQRPYK